MRDPEPRNLARLVERLSAVPLGHGRMAVRRVVPQMFDVRSGVRPFRDPAGPTVHHLLRASSRRATSPHFEAWTKSKITVERGVEQATSVLESETLHDRLALLGIRRK